VSSLADFEVIEIVDSRTPYPSLLRLYSTFNNQAITDLKKRQMIIEVEDLKVNVSLDPTKGRIYVELVKGKELDNLYNMTAKMDDYVNPSTNGVHSWRSIISCMLDSEEYLENWQ
jgi:hypothetical protein